MRLIDADALNDRITTIEFLLGVDLQTVHNFVDNAPTVDNDRIFDCDETPKVEVKEKTGKWLVTPTGFVYCSECGAEPPDDCNIRFDYCPNCGALIEGFSAV